MSLKEIKGYGNTAYILDDEELFKISDYKRIKLEENQCDFVSCSQVKLNGKKKLLYFTNEYDSLAQVLPTLSSEKVVMLISDLIKTVISIKSQGYLKCERICLDASKVFVDKSKWTVKVIYFPAEIETENASNFDNAFSSEIIKLVDISNCLDDTNASKIRSAMSNGSFSLEEKYQVIASLNKGNVYPIKQEVEEYSENTLPITKLAKQPTLVFFSTNTAEDIRFEISKPEFVIGRKADVVDGYIGISNAIGRVHCKIVFNNGYYLVDLESSNGTFINDKRLEPNVPTALNKGDLVRLAKSNFKVMY